MRRTIVDEVLTEQLEAVAQPFDAEEKINRRARAASSRGRKAGLSGAMAAGKSTLDER